MSDETEARGPAERANDRRVLFCCCLGMFVQALVINLTPLLFLPLKAQYGLTFEQVGRLVLVNFLTQMVVDLACAALADRVPLKPLIVAANLLGAVGLWLFALGPALFPASPYDGLILGTVVFSVGCGLLEVLLSPIMNAVPLERGDSDAHRAADMALLHAFYPIGKVAVIAVTALALWRLGAARWPAVALAWSVFPLANAFAFAGVRLPRLAPEGDARQPLRALVRLRGYLALLACIFLAGATELTLGQWTSAFLERAVGLPKLAADLAGFGLFGVGMVVGRLWMGLRGAAHELRTVMRRGALLSAATCAVVALSPWPWASLLACAPAGAFVSVLWPGSLSLAAARFPLAGASMFALMAASGDTGAAVTPWAVGVVADAFPPPPVGLRAGLVVTALAPLALAALLAAMGRRRRGAAARA